MKTTQNRIDEIALHGYNLDFSAVFSHAFTLYKKIALLCGVALLLAGILVAAFGLATFLLFFSLEISRLQELREFSITSLSPAGVVAYFFMVVFIAGLSAAFNAGLIKMAYNADHGKEPSLSDAFEYYRAPYFMRLLVAALMISTVTSLCTITFELLSIKPLGIILSIAVAILTFLVTPLIIFGDLPAASAIRGSIRVVAKNFLMVTCLLIVSWFFAVLGIVVCCVGIIFTMPIVYAMYYSLYVHSVGLGEDEKETHFTDL